MHSKRNRRGGALAWVLIMLAAVMALAVAAAVGVGWFVASNVHVTKARGNTVVDTPFGSMRLRERARFDPEQFGVPVYPGAVGDNDSRKLASFEFDLGEEHREFSVLAAHYSTADPPGRVAEFYRERLPKWTVIEKSATPWRRAECRFEFRGNGLRRIVVIRGHGGVTHIGLASIGEPASN